MRSFEENYLFMKQVLHHSLKIDVVLFRPPFTSISELDYELRKIFWSNFDYYDEEHGIKPLKELPVNQVLCLHSKLGFTNILYRVPAPYEDCIMAFGPFLAEDSHPDFLHSIVTKNHFPIHVVQMIQAYYKMLPAVDLLTMLNTIQTLICHFITNYCWNNIKIINFSDSQTDESACVPEPVHSHKFALLLHEDYITSHNAVFAKLGQDNYEEIYKDLDLFLKKISLQKETNIQQIKYVLHKFNVKCEFVILQKKVHYTYISKVYATFEEKITGEQHKDKLLLMPYEMIKKYSLLVRNHSLAQYSQTVRKVIDYINMHLQEPLSLSYLSEKFDKNRSFLSHQFKKETGQTITNFILERRISYATNLLNTTTLSIQEVAEKVGILELNYFSKLFKKQIGMSPTEYKRLIH